MFARAAGDAVAGILENFLGVIEDHVDPAPLLEHGQHHAENEHRPQPRIEQFRGSRPARVSLASVPSISATAAAA